MYLLSDQPKMIVIGLKEEDPAYVFQWWFHKQGQMRIQMKAAEWSEVSLEWIEHFHHKRHQFSERERV